MEALLDVILPVFLLIGFGYVAVWSGYFSDSVIDALMRFTQSFAFPCLLFVAIARLDLGQSFDLRLLGSYYTGALICFIVGMIGARHLFGRSWPDSVTIGFCALFSNTLMLGLPITDRAFGPEALAGNYAIIAFHSPFCYFIGITAMEMARANGRPSFRLAGVVLRAIFRNPLIVGIAAGFAVNLLGLALPGPLESALDLMVKAALPTALFGMGGVLVRYRPEGDLRIILYVIAISLLLHPLFVSLAGLAVGLPDAAYRSAVLTAAMAPGINSYIFANMYGSARRVAASSVLIATAVSLLTVWLWLATLP